MNIRKIKNAFTIAALLFATSLNANPLLYSPAEFKLPSLGPVPPCEKCFDILGVKTGPSCSELKGNNEKVAQAKLRLPGDDSFYSPEYVYLKTVTRNDDAGVPDTLVVNCGPSPAGDVVFRIKRTIDLSKGDLPAIQAVEKSLTAKYGEPSYVAKQRGQNDYYFYLSKDLAHPFNYDRNFAGDLELMDNETFGLASKALDANIGLALVVHVALKEQNVENMMFVLNDYARFAYAYDAISKWSEVFVSKAKANAAKPKEGSVPKL
jgi:hypothetical protein